MIAVPKELFAKAVNIVIHIERSGYGLKIREIARVGGFSEEKYDMLNVA